LGCCAEKYFQWRIMDEFTIKPKNVNVVLYNLIVFLSIVVPGIPLGTGLAYLFMNMNTSRLGIRLWFASILGGYLGSIGGYVLFLIINLLVWEEYLVKIDNLKIVITPDQVIGPTFWKAKRLSLQLKEIVKETLSRQSLFDKLLGLQSIETINGEKIVLIKMYYGKEQSDNCLKLLAQKLDQADL
jgi:hypothetical protein